ncbi:MAG: carboxypeptidase-like regulatory domain-containing protein [Candidatus Limnocylindrales bacterium]
MTRDRRLPVLAVVAGSVVIVVAAALLAGSATPAISPHGGPAAPLGGAPGGVAPAGAGTDAHGQGWTIRNAEKHDVSKPLRQVKSIITPGQQDPDMMVPLVLGGHTGRTVSHAPDGALQPASAVASTSVSAPVQNFDGTSNRNGVLPPDTNGDVGPNDYVQFINLSLAVYSKTGTLLYGPTNGNTIWSGFGGPCETRNDGDPIVMYDPLADRWMVSQFALPNFPSGPYYQCIAVSQTADPTGAWYRYSFVYSTTKMNDYPKFGVWPDGYYMSTNQFTGGSSWGGQGVAVFERSQMLQGLPARMVSFDLYGVDPNLGGMLPSDLDGPAPPSGAPNAFMEFDDNSQGWPQDQLQVWNFHVDWTNTANSTFTPASTLATASFDSNLCNYSRNCIPQAGTTVKLDALSDRLMNRIQYRNFGSYQTMVVNDSVDVNGADRAGIRWYELRNTGSGWSIYQQGTYSPDSTNRWMGSAAMDGNGAIALGYSASSSSLYPSIRYTGRLAGDPLGTLPQGEGTIINGTGAQTHSASRWGDYSMLAVDPVDDCTFWYTNEYLTTTSSASWRTRIASFTLPDCGAAPPTTGNISGKVTNSSGGAAISGASVAISGGASTTTDSSGNYSFTGLAPNSYSLTASRTGFTSSAPANVVVTAGANTVQNFALVPVPPTTGSISGKVTNSSGGAAISGASVAISGGASTTTDGSGNYSFTGLAPNSYSLTASRTGFTTSAPASVTVTAGATTTQNFALVPVPTLNTGYRFGTTATAVTSGAGDNNGYQSGSANLFSFNNVVATDTSSGTGSSQSCTSSLRDKENLSGYSFGLPGSAAIKGISVQIRGRASTTSNTPKFCVLLSWNGGTSWTAGKLTPTLGTTLTTYTLGSSTDLWGRSWTPANFAASSFRVRIVDLANSTSTTFYCDGVSVQVTYQ